MQQGYALYDDSTCSNTIADVPSKMELVPAVSGLYPLDTSEANDIQFQEVQDDLTVARNIPDLLGIDRPDVRTLQKKNWFFRWLSVFGPGLVVMLADTDAGCIITAANTGAAWGYSLIWLQILLIIVVYMTQELTVRLGLHTGMGHGELIREHFGGFWAWLSAGSLVIACTGALVSEMSGVVGVGNLLHIPPAASACTAAAFLLAIVISGKYRHVEKVALVLGLCELTYIITMIMTFSKEGFKRSFARVELQNSGYSFLVAANIGAVVMPWMIFYQQSAVVDKGLRTEDLRLVRIDTFTGACLTQLIMCAVISTCAGTIWIKSGGNFPNPDPPSTIGEYSQAIEASLGEKAGKALFIIGLLGGAMIGAIVVALTAAWGLGEVAGFKHSLEHSPRDAPWFYVVFVLCVAIGVAICLSPVNLVYLNLVIQIMNAFLLPVVLGLLWMLAVKVLPEKHKLKGWYKWVCAAVFSICAGLGVFGGIYGLATGEAGA